MINVVAVIQARKNSTRLPGKVLLPAPDGRPLLQLMVERVRKAKTLDKIVVAVPDTDLDFYQEVGELFRWEAVHVIPGPEQDVLSRVYQAAWSTEATHVVRLTADCPLVDPAELDQLVQDAVWCSLDYVKTGDSYPEGLDVEVLSDRALWLLRHQVTSSFDREHVTSGLEHLTAKLRKDTVEYPVGRLEHWGKIRVTLDYPEDYTVLQNVLTAAGPEITLLQLVQLYQQQPDLFAANAHIPRNEWKQQRP